MNVIDKFNGEHSFLSNFSPANITWRGQVWPTTEHAFQAAKTDNKDEQKAIRKAGTPGQAKKLGRLVTLRPSWEGEKIGVMREVLHAKFTQNPSLKDDLLDTGDSKLVESNNWKDIFWGVCKGKGQNWLGKLLMELRDSLSQNQCLLVYADDDSKVSVKTDQSIWKALKTFKVSIEYDKHLDLLKVRGSSKELDKILTAGLLTGVQLEKDGTFTALKE